MNLLTNFCSSYSWIRLLVIFLVKSMSHVCSKSSVYRNLTMTHYLFFVYSSNPGYTKNHQIWNNPFEYWPFCLSHPTLTVSIVFSTSPMLLFCYRVPPFGCSLWNTWHWVNLVSLTYYSILLSHCSDHDYHWYIYESEDGTDWWRYCGCESMVIWW